MPFCSKCGTEVPENVSFCQKCGNAMQGGQKGNISSTLNGILGSSWNPGKTITSIALAIAFIAMFLPWAQLAYSAAGGSVTANGWGSIARQGPILTDLSKFAENSDVSFISTIAISCFLISLATGIYGITRKNSTKLVQVIKYPCIVISVLLAMFFFFAPKDANSLVSGGMLLFSLSMATVGIGISYSDKSLKNHR